MKIETLTHSFMISPSPGFVIDDVNFDGSDDGTVVITVIESLRIIPIEADTDSEKDDLIKSLQEQVDSIGRVRVTEKGYKDRIDELVQKCNDLEQKNILLLSNQKEVKITERSCECGCGHKFIPTGKYHKYASDCPNKEQRLKEDNLRRKHKERNLDRVDRKKIEMKDEQAKEVTNKQELPEPGCDNCLDRESCRKTGFSKCDIMDSVEYRHYKPKIN